MTNRVKLDAYDWSKISQQAADRARAESEVCEQKATEVTVAVKQLEQIKNTTMTLLNDADSGLPTKVDKEVGKQLSTNDYTDEDKARVTGMVSAQYVQVPDGTYATYSGLEQAINSVCASPASNLSDIKFKFTCDRGVLTSNAGDNVVRFMSVSKGPYLHFVAGNDDKLWCMLSESFFNPTYKLMNRRNAELITEDCNSKATFSIAFKDGIVSELKVSKVTMAVSSDNRIVTVATPGAMPISRVNLRLEFDSSVANLKVNDIDGLQGAISDLQAAVSGKSALTHIHNAGDVMVNASNFGADYLNDCLDSIESSVNDLTTNKMDKSKLVIPDGWSAGVGTLYKEGDDLKYNITDTVSLKVVTDVELSSLAALKVDKKSGERLINTNEQAKVANLPSNTNASLAQKSNINHTHQLYTFNGASTTIKSLHTHMPTTSVSVNIPIIDPGDYLAPSAYMSIKEVSKRYPAATIGQTLLLVSVSGGTWFNDPDNCGGDLYGNDHKIIINPYGGLYQNSFAYLMLGSPYITYEYLQAYAYANIVSGVTGAIASARWVKVVA